MNNSIKKKQKRGRKKKPYKLKNPLWHGSKLSRYKLIQVIDCFAKDMTAKEASSETRIHEKTIQQKFRVLTKVFIESSYLYAHLYNGAGRLLFLGPSPAYPRLYWEKCWRQRGIISSDRLKNKLGDNYEWKPGKSNSLNFFKFERHLRAMIPYQMDTNVNSLIAHAFSNMYIISSEVYDQLQQRQKAGLASSWSDRMELIWTSCEKNNRQVIKDETWSTIFKEENNVLDGHQLIKRGIIFFLSRHPIKKNAIMPSPITGYFQQNKLSISQWQLTAGQSDLLEKVATIEADEIIKARKVAIERGIELSDLQIIMPQRPL